MKQLHLFIYLLWRHFHWKLSHWWAGPAKMFFVVLINWSKFICHFNYLLANERLICAISINWWWCRWDGQIDAHIDTLDTTQSIPHTCVMLVARWFHLWSKSNAPKTTHSTSNTHKFHSIPNADVWRLSQRILFFNAFYSHEPQFSACANVGIHDLVARKRPTIRQYDGQWSRLTRHDKFSNVHFANERIVVERNRVVN